MTEVFAYLILAPLLGGLINGAVPVVKGLLIKSDPAVPQGDKPENPFSALKQVWDSLRNPGITEERNRLYFAAGTLVLMMAAGSLFFAGQNLGLIVFVFILYSLARLGCFFGALFFMDQNRPGLQQAKLKGLLRVVAYLVTLAFSATGFYLVSATFTGTGSLMVADILSLGLTPGFLLPGMLPGFLLLLLFDPGNSLFSFGSQGIQQEITSTSMADFGRGRAYALLEIAGWYETVFYLGIIFLFHYGGDGVSGVLAVLICLIVIFLRMLSGREAIDKIGPVRLLAIVLILLTGAFINLIALM